MNVVYFRSRKQRGNAAKLGGTPTRPQDRSMYWTFVRPTRRKTKSNAQRLPQRDKVSCHVLKIRFVAQLIPTFAT